MNVQEIKTTIEGMEALLYILKQQIGVSEETVQTEYIPFPNEDVEYYNGDE
jgi:hypothetical protein